MPHPEPTLHLCNSAAYQNRCLRLILAALAVVARSIDPDATIEADPGPEPVLPRASWVIEQARALDRSESDDPGDEPDDGDAILARFANQDESGLCVDF